MPTFDTRFWKATVVGVRAFTVNEDGSAGDVQHVLSLQLEQRKPSADDGSRAQPLVYSLDTHSATLDALHHCIEVTPGRTSRPRRGDLAERLR